MKLLMSFVSTGLDNNIDKIANIIWRWCTMTSLSVITVGGNSNETVKIWKYLGSL
jgi:hypothetical protein